MFSLYSICLLSFLQQFAEFVANLFGWAVSKSIGSSLDLIPNSANIAFL